ncbi:MAG: hypothetical protein ABIQ52_02190 [Vicinamibacterales bacterium]
MNPFAPSPSPEASPAGAAPAESPPPTPEAPVAPAAPLVAPAVLKFKSCRWRCDPDDGEFCTHRDVLPFAGKNDFKADSWCPECAFYKLRRTPKKRDWAAERANNY